MMDLTTNIMLLVSVMTTFSPAAITSSELASQLAPLNSTFPLFPGLIEVSAFATLPIYSSSRCLEFTPELPNFRLNQFLKSNTVTNELEMNKIICVLIEMSVKEQTIATIHAPIPKKKRMKPGIANSRAKNINPMQNQISALFKISFIHLANSQVSGASSPDIKCNDFNR